VIMLPYPDEDRTPQPPSLSPVQLSAAQIASVRELVQPAWRANVSEDTIRRFLTAVGGRDVAAAAKRLNTTLLWRDSVQPEKIVCTACAKNPKSHYMHVIGYDKLNRPIIYSCLGLAANRNVADSQAHMIQTFEMAIKCMQEGQEQWIWACDFHGFGLRDVDPRLAKLFLDLSAAHYPERLGQFLIMGAPTLFGALWKAVSPFVDRKTYGKIRFLPYDLDSPKSVMREQLEELCDPTTAQWMLTEMQENRDEKKVASKLGKYNMAHIHRAASEGVLLSGASDASIHDFRGHLQLLKAFASSPQLMEPQALHVVLEEVAAK